LSVSTPSPVVGKYTEKEQARQAQKQDQVKKGGCCKYLINIITTKIPKPHYLVASF
jgi:hypothetical protein